MPNELIDRLITALTHDKNRIEAAIAQPKYRLHVEYDAVLVQVKQIEQTIEKYKKDCENPNSNDDQQLKNAKDLLDAKMYVLKQKEKVVIESPHTAMYGYLKEQYTNTDNRLADLFTLNQTWLQQEIDVYENRVKVQELSQRIATLEATPTTTDPEECEDCEENEALVNELSNKNADLEVEVRKLKSRLDANELNARYEELLEAYTNAEREIAQLKKQERTRTGSSSLSSRTATPRPERRAILPPDNYTSFYSTQPPTYPWFMQNNRHY